VSDKQPSSPKPSDVASITEDDIGAAITGIIHAVEAKYHTMTEDELRAKWYFKWDPEASLAWNHYQFYDHLALYAGSCRRWEHIHNGYTCIVERVRDKYLMPKIREFVEQVRQATEASTQG
jgi:hypothetical protein